jgi:hypothetical protein
VSGSIGLTKAGVALDAYVLDKPYRRAVIRYVDRLTGRCRRVHDALQGVKEEQMVLMLLRKHYAADLKRKWSDLEQYPRRLMHAYLCTLTKPGPYNFQTKSQMHRPVPPDQIRWDDWSVDSDPDSPCEVPDSDEEDAEFGAMNFAALDDLGGGAAADAGTPPARTSMEPTQSELDLLQAMSTLSRNEMKAKLYS